MLYLGFGSQLSATATLIGLQRRAGQRVTASGLSACAQGCRGTGFSFTICNPVAPARIVLMSVHLFARTFAKDMLLEASFLGQKDKGAAFSGAMGTQKTAPGVQMCLPQDLCMFSLFLSLWSHEGCKRLLSTAGATCLLTSCLAPTPTTPRPMHNTSANKKNKNKSNISWRWLWHGGGGGGGDGDDGGGDGGGGGGIASSGGW